MFDQFHNGWKVCLDGLQEVTSLFWLSCLAIWLYCSQILAILFSHLILLLPDFGYPVYRHFVLLLPDFGYPVYSHFVLLLPEFGYPGENHRPVASD
jgi:hypothetical protein